jgi:hypothetical protein
VHLWYRAPANGLRQALADPQGRYGLAWQVDIKAGWSYGIAPGAVTAVGTYRLRSGDSKRPGRMPAWLAAEVQRVSGPRPPSLPAGSTSPGLPGGSGPAAYLTTVVTRGAARLAAMTDGRQRALSALAYQAGGLLRWSGLDGDQVTGQLIDAGTASGLSPSLAERAVRRAFANGIARPLTSPRSRGYRAS